jgi:ABC-type nitrate/sulfonate/bicarbonate transport system ATPase subunit
MDAVSVPVLTVQHLTKTIGSQTIIRDLSFSIGRGGRVTLFAPSGSGKTTLINILSHLDPDFGGAVTVHAQQPSTIFQEPRLFAYMSVRENIFFPLVVQQRPITPQTRACYTQWLEVCGLTGYERHYPCQISGGMKQKVSLIRSFITRPDFVMMDEPFKSIDLAAKNRIIRHIVREYPQATILLVTHNLDEIPLLTQSLMLFKTHTLSDFTEYPDLADYQPSELLSLIFRELAVSSA